MGLNTSKNYGYCIRCQSWLLQSCNTNEKHHHHFELNGQPREVTVIDIGAQEGLDLRAKANPGDPYEIGAGMPGKVLSVDCRVGDAVTTGQTLLVSEAMKMETAIHADRACKIGEIVAPAGTRVDTSDLLVALA